MHSPYVLLIYGFDCDRGSYTITNRPGLPVAENSQFTAHSTEKGGLMANQEILGVITKTLHQEKQFKNYAFFQYWEEELSFYVLLGRTTPVPTHLPVTEMDVTDCETVTAPSTSHPRRKEHTEGKDTVTDVDWDSFFNDTDHDGGSARGKWNTGEYYKNSIAKDWSGWESDWPSMMTPASSELTSAHMKASTGKRDLDWGCYRSAWDSIHNDPYGYEHISSATRGYASKTMEW